MRLIPRHNPQQQDALPRWKLHYAILASLTGAVALTAVAFYTGWEVLGAETLKNEKKLTTKTLFDLVKLSFGVVAGAGALVALVVAYRKQRVTEADAKREVTRLHTERFTAAVTQLGDDSTAVRLGGVHALAGLADDAPTRDLRQTCIDVLCAYLRLPYSAQGDIPENDAEAQHAYLALREVRHTIIRLIRDHLRLSTDESHSWQGHEFDFTGVVFDGGNFAEAVFSGGMTTFAGARFSGGRVHFIGAVFSGGIVDFRGAEFIDGLIAFHLATFSGAYVVFTGATTSRSGLDFEQATFLDGTLELRNMAFSRGGIEFTNVAFSGSRVNLERMSITSGGASFVGATFSGGEVNLWCSRFTDSVVHFVGAKFSGSTVNFAGATFSGRLLNFSNTTFSGGLIDFRATQFTGGEVSFAGAEFTGGEVDFTGAEYSGAEVDFSRAQGAIPAGLVPPSGHPLPEGLRVPHAWHRPEQ